MAHIQRNPDGSLMYPWYDPRNLDLGITEAYASTTGQALSDEGGSQLNPSGILSPFDVNPDSYDPGGSDSNAILTNDQGTTGTFDQLYPNVSTNDSIGGVENVDYFTNAFGDRQAITQDTGGGGETEDQRIARLFAEQVALARKAAEAGRVQAQQGWDMAKGIFDEGIGTLGTRRGEFTDIFNRGSNQILGRYEQERGNLQAGNQGQETNLRNSLRALGMGGSAFMKGQGRLRQQAAGQLGNLAQQRSDNDLSNQQGYNTNQEWATGQETGLNRYLQNASDQLVNANNQIGLAEQGDVAQINQNVSSLMAQINAQQAALRAAQGNISGYAANPYAPDMSSFAGVLSGGGANVGGNQQAGNQASSVTQDGYTLADLLKQQAGGNMYT